jgi:hypothetical protein
MLENNQRTSRICPKWASEFKGTVYEFASFSYLSLNKSLYSARYSNFKPPSEVYNYFDGIHGHTESIEFSTPEFYWL